MLLHGLSDRSRFVQAVRSDRKQSKVPANAVEADGAEAYERMKYAFGHKGGEQ